ncbi:MAG: L-threonylcarbamoyladenylate synthase [Rhodospirillales bacterium]|jgi:L-threonylcarbamoyladenylate synthase|nr:L-threonylcarbamoyladenylate synthase [Rhodospirillales bacterium]
MPPQEPVFVQPDEAGLEQAAAALRAGGLVAFPTETVYGLGADAADDHAVARIFEVKDRPAFNPLIVHLRDQAHAREFCVWNDSAETLAQHLWPGALTIVLQRKADARLSALVSAGLQTVAVRVPDQDIAQQLLHRSGLAIAAPSANPSGAVSPTTAAHVAASFAGGSARGIDCIVDGGPCRIGLESTVVDVTGGTPVLLRPGGVTTEAIRDLIGALDDAPPADAVKSPGMLSRHYAPGARLRLNAGIAEADEVLLGFGPGAPEDALNLSETGDLTQAAAHLFAMLRQLDQPGISAIAVMPIPESGLGRAINDRLRRGANRE